jgi:hypothetical protein
MFIEPPENGITYCIYITFGSLPMEIETPREYCKIVYIDNRYYIFVVLVRKVGRPQSMAGCLSKVA